jgi:Recombinase zinc beta ribbon domain/Recombinase
VPQQLAHNQAGVSPFVQTTKSGQAYKNQSTGWHGSYIAKIVNNPAVFGEFQPHKYDAKGRKVADGSAIPDYYPKIVEKELFLRAKQSRFGRDFRDQYAAKGRKGEFVSNLFSGLARCAYCGGSMRFENKGPGPKGGAYLVCDKIKRGLGCKNLRWRYKDFEASFQPISSAFSFISIAMCVDIVRKVALRRRLRSGATR